MIQDMLNMISEKGKIEATAVFGEKIKAQFKFFSSFFMLIVVMMSLAMLNLLYGKFFTIEIIVVLGLGYIAKVLVDFIKWQSIKKIDLSNIKSLFEIKKIEASFDIHYAIILLLIFAILVMINIVILPILALAIINLVAQVYKIEKIKKLNVTNLAETYQKIEIVEKSVAAFLFIPVFIVFLFYLYSLNLQIEMVGIVFVVSIGIIALLFLEVYRIGSVNLAKIEKNGIEIKPEKEKIIGSVFGVLSFSMNGTSILGKGKVNNSENGIIFTDKRIIFVEVPVQGGSNIVGEMNYTLLNHFFNKREINELGMSMLKDIKNFSGHVKKIIENKEIKEWKLDGMIFSVNGQRYFLGTDENSKKVKNIIKTE